MLLSSVYSQQVFVASIWRKGVPLQATQVSPWIVPLEALEPFRSALAVLSNQWSGLPVFYQCIAKVVQRITRF